MMRAALILALLLLPLKAPAIAGVVEAHGFLDGLVGTWEGSGTSAGNPITDRMVFSRGLRPGVLKMEMKALSGDDFRAEGYLLYDAKAKVYRFYEFSNVFAARVCSGVVEGGALRMKDERGVLIELKMTGRDTLTLYEDGPPEVKETFRRLP